MVLKELEIRIAIAFALIAMITWLLSWYLLAYVG